MSTWNIYHKDGTKLTDVNGEQIIVHGLEYSDSWMGECYVTINFKNNAPINFQIGDYIVYRGERFELNYEPGKDKQARLNTYGDGFVYDSVKFNAMQDELSRAEFKDVVLHDNELHYTALPKFSFYVEILDDLLDRIQANLDEQIGEGKWKIFSRHKERSMQRGVSEEEWNAAYGENTTNNVIESKSITIDTKTCWEALALVNSEWDVNFIVRGRNIYVGTAGVIANHIFKYGLGEGLYEIEQNADPDQQVITRLSAYGSEKNLPSHYYADLGIKYKANITKVTTAENEQYHNVDFLLDLDYIETYFKNKRTYNNGKDSYGWVLKVTFDFKTIITGYVTEDSSTKKCRFYSEVKGSDNDTGDEPSQDSLDAFIAQVKEGNTLLYMTNGINSDTIPYANKEYAKNLPNNMAINRLMLPGFPTMSLNDFWGTLTDEEKKYCNPSGREHKFSTDPHRPYIDSLNIDKIGLRSASQFFDTDDKTNGIIEIYPTIEEMVINNVRVDEINEGVAPEDDGRFNDGQTVANVDIYLSPYIDFDINDLKETDFSISMKDGMCGGRTFNVAASTKINGRWRLTIERVKDDALDLWFPYNDYPIRKGDHFVLTGIKLPDSYVRAASLKLLKYAIALLDKNDYTRYVYQPKVDEIFMARQNDQALADKTGAIKSLYQTLKAGDLMDFDDDDLGIDGQITIDQLTIKEEDGKIPTYEVTLREDKEVGTIQKIKQNISSLENGNGSLTTTSQVKNQITIEGSKHFLSKTKDDSAQGLITFLRGLKVGDYNGENGGSWTPDSDGRSHLVTDYLEVRMKAIFEELVIKKTSTIGGKEIISPAGGVVAHKVDEVTVTYKEVSQKAYRCYFLAEQDGDEVDNDFALEDQVRSESFNVKKGKYHKVGNHFLWRLVIGRDEEPVEIDGKKYHYIDLSMTDCATASDAPMNGDVLSQCGNRSDKERQNCLIFSAVDTFSPSITLYHGINSYSFANKEYVEYGVNKQTNKAFFNVYGDMYVGDRPTKENNYEGSSYVKYDSESKKVTIKAELSVGSTFDGKTLEQQIKDNAPKGLSEGDVNTIINNSTVISDLQNQIDGAIETWFYDGVPTLSNAPAKDWTTDKEKNTHLGDLYYDNKTGKAYRFAKDGSTYKWTVITDTDITKALDNASKAQETADGKMTVFSSQPKPPYQLGDIWVNATYPTDGSTYKNDVLRCKTSKKSGTFSINDWMLASKYTDDTVANAAKTAAENAQKAASKAQSDVNNLDKTVTSNKTAFDKYVSDGYLEPSEIAAMVQDSKRLEDDFAAAEKSYNEVKDSEVLANTKQLTDLVSAFGTFKTAKTELITYISDIATRYNAADSDGKATIMSAVGTKYTNFQSAYSAFYDKLGLANAYITSKIYGELGIVIGDVASYNYLKKALSENAKTDIVGGLILSSLIALRDPNTGYVQSGINGVVDTTAKGNGIATWWGGYMNDGQVVGFDKNTDITKQAATSLVRFDGSGYLANGSIYWGTDGKVHADPTSFIISEKNLGAYLAFFEPTWKTGSDGSNVKDLVSLTPQAPFTKLGVSGDLNVEGKVNINGVTITYDASNKALKIDGSIYATGGISAYGDSKNEGGGGLNASVLSYANILAGSYEDSDLSHIPNAYAIKALSSRIDNISNELGGLNLDWSNITGKPSTFTPSAHTHKWADITDHPTKLTQFSNDAGFTTNKGTVTSVAMTAPTGFAVTGSPITTSGTLALGFASGYSLPTTTKQGQWDTAYSQRHTHSNKAVLDGITSALVTNWNTAYTNNHAHSNKSVLDGISSTKVSHWDSAYNWYVLMTTDETEADGVINKWNEVVNFLANIAQTDTLSGIIDGINKSISDEATRAKGVESTLNTNLNAEVSRAKGAESILSSSISSNKTAITTLQGYFTSGSANSAIKLQTARTLWGQSFDGSTNVSGNLSSVGNITSLKSDAYSIGSSDNIFAKVYAHRIITPASTALYLATAGVDRMMINSGGLVGMGTTSPTEKLHVVGNLFVDVADGGYINIGGIKIQYDKANGAIKVNGNLYATGGVSAYGSSDAQGGGGLNGSVLSYADILAGDYEDTDLTKIPNAYAIKALSNRIESITSTGATDIEVSGSGNAITSVTKDGNVITFTKGITFLTSHQSLSAYLKSDDAASTYSTLSHTHKVKINGVVKEILKSSTADASVVDLGTYLTSHQSLADYLKSADAEKTYSKLGHTHGYATTVKVGSTSYTVASNVISLPAYPTIPTALKNPTSLTIQANGTSLGTYDGSVAKTFNLTYSNVGAAAASHTHTFASLTSKPTTLSGYGITDAYTKNESDKKYLGITATAKNSEKFNGRSFWEFFVEGRRSIDNITSAQLKAHVDNTDVKAGSENFLKLNSGSYSYDNGGSTATLLVFTNSGASASSLELFFNYTRGSALRIRRTIDNNRISGDWEDLITSVNIGNQSVKYAASAGAVAWANVTSKPTSLSGYGIADGVNAVSVTGSGNAITAASISGHSLTLTKGSTFSLSNHNHDNTYLKLSGGTLTGGLTVNANITATGIGSFGKVKIGDIYIINDGKGNLYIQKTDGTTAANFYATGGITAYGESSTSSGGGGLNASVLSYESALKLTSNTGELSQVASAWSVKALHDSILDLQGGSATNIETTGSGNAVTSITKDGTTISVVKGSTFLTSHQSLADYLKIADAKTAYSPIGHTHSVKINGATKTIAATSGTAVDLGTYLTSHQTIYGLTIQKNGTSLGTYTPNSGAKTINVTVPTKVSELANDSKYITGNQSISLTGDVTGSGTTSINTTIGNGKVSNAKLANSSIKVGSRSVSLGGTLTQIDEAYLSWGGRNYAGNFGPLDASLVPELGANRLAFMPANAVTIEYSRDGGTTWVDYGASDAQKINLFNGCNTQLTIGKNTSLPDDMSKCMLRVTFDSRDGAVYTALQKFVILVSTNNATGCYVTIDGALGADPTNFSKVFVDKVSLNGWSGYNVINPANTITTWGGGSGSFATSQYKKVRFTFGCTGKSSGTQSGLQVISIFGFGGVGWATPSSMARNGHIYTYDYNKNVTFPSIVNAKTFVGSLSGKATSATSADTASKVANALSWSGYSSGSYNGSAAKTITIPNNTNQLTNGAGFTTNKGTVTSVGLSVPTGLSVSGSPITTSGTLAISLASGYSIPTTAKQGNWDSVYNWYVGITKADTDNIINKWDEIIAFLANIKSTETLDGIVSGINTSISNEVTRAKNAESALATRATTLEGYFTSGSAKKALQLTNARKLWGNSFNGTADVNGSIVVPGGNYISIGNIKLEYDSTNKALKITNTTTSEVANLYASGGISAYGDGTSSAGGSVLSSVAYSDSLKLASEELNKVATAYSIAQLSARIATIENGAVMGSVDWDAITNKPSTFAPSSHTHTFASLTEKPSTLSGYGITDAKIANGVITLGGTSITPLTSHQSLANYYTKSSVDNLLNGKADSSHTHSSLALSTTNVEPGNGSSHSSMLLSVKPYYAAANSVPSFYGNILEIEALGGSQLAMQWTGGQSKSDGTDTNVGRLYYRSRRDNCTAYTTWRTIAWTSDIPTKVSQLSNDKNYLTSHQSLDGYVNAISVTGSGNAVTSVSKSGKTITFTKGSTFLTSHQSLAGYATESWVNGRLFERPDSGIDANGLSVAWKTYEIYKGVNMPTSNDWHQVVCWGTGDTNYVFQMANGYTGDIGMYYRQKTGSNWGNWKKFIDSSNIGSQSVNYANSAGNAKNCYVEEGSGDLSIMLGFGIGDYRSLRKQSDFHYNIDESTLHCGNIIGYRGKFDGGLIVGYNYDNILRIYGSDSGNDEKIFIQSQIDNRTDDYDIPSYGSYNRHRIILQPRGGRVGICDSNPMYSLEVGGEGTCRIARKLMVATTDTSSALNVGGDIAATGGITAYSSSDRRLKKDLAVMDSLSVIKSLGSVYSFTYRKSGERSIGLIAQNVQNSILSDLVAKDNDGYLKLNYWSPKLISLALGGVMQVDSEVSKLKRKVRKLEQVNQRLIMEVKQLKNKENRK